MITRYYHGFARASPAAALHYICLIPLVYAMTPFDRQGYTLCHQRILELVLDTDAYTILLGDISGDGSVAVRPSTRFRC
jgi:hypothetical protein